MMKIENKIDALKIPEYITCKECMGTYREITNTHLKKHKITMEIYKKRHPETPTHSSTTLLKHSKQRKEYLKKHPECYGTPIQLAKMRLLLYTPEAKKKSKKNMELINKLPATRMHRSEVKKKLYKTNKKYRENLKKLHEKLPERNKEMWKNKEYRNKMIRTHRGKILSNDTKEKISKSQVARYDKKRKVKKDKLLLEILKLVDIGYNHTEIAEKLNMNRSTISRWIKKLKVVGS